MPSANRSPMLCTRRSDQRFTGWLDSARLGRVDDPLAIALPVVNDCVWQKTQPVVANAARPFTMDGVSGAGVGGASIRMKSANASPSDLSDLALLGGAGGCLAAM